MMCHIVKLRSLARKAFFNIFFFVRNSFSFLIVMLIYCTLFFIEAVMLQSRMGILDKMFVCYDCLLIYQTG